MPVKKSILFVNQSSGSLMLDIVNAFVQTNEYKNVDLVAGEINIRPTRPDTKVKIIKTIKYNKRNTFTRFLTWTIAFAHLLIIVTLKNKHYELFLVSNPPLNIFIPFFTKKQFSILIYDIYPETLVAQKILSQNSWLIKKWASANKKIFRKAKNVFTISSNMKTVLTKYVDEEKIKVVYNWCHPVKTVHKEENNFLKQHEIKEKFIVLYSGNIGLTHDLDIMIEVAKILEDEIDIQFVFIGEGGKKKMMVEKIRQYHLRNCLVLPYQPNEILNQTMGGADIGIVTLDSGSNSLSIPSKTNRFLAMGIPILCIADKESELVSIVEDNMVGKCFSKLETKEIANFVLKMQKEKQTHETYKKNSLKLASKFTPKNAKLFIV